MGEAHKQVASQGKLSCTAPLLPYLTQLEGITSSERCKSKQVDGFVQDTLLRNCFDAFEQYSDQNGFFQCSCSAQVHPLCIKLCFEVCNVLCNFVLTVLPKLRVLNKKGRLVFQQKSTVMGVTTNWNGWKILEKLGLTPPTIRILRAPPT